MTNFENIKQMSKEDLAKFLCDMQSADDCANSCPARDMCRLGHNGMVKWLESEDTE